MIHVKLTVPSFDLQQAMSSQFLRIPLGCQKLEPSNARVYHHVLHHVSSKKGNVGVSPNFQRIWRFPEVSKMGGTPVPQIIQN